MSKAIRILVLLFILFLIAGGLLAVGIFVLSDGNPVRWVQTELIRLSLSGRQEDLARSVGSDTTDLRFTIDVGDAPRTVAENLYAQNLILDKDLFVDFLRLEGLDTQIEAGTYFLNQAQTIPQIAHIIIDSRNSSITFRVGEGTRIEEVAEAIDANGLFGFSGQSFLEVTRIGFAELPEYAAIFGAPSDASLEGYLLPDTYVLPPSITAIELRDVLLEAFVATIQGQLINDIQAQGWSVHDIVKLASIVEREAVWDEENPTIASVYRNRLDIGMTLDADPTVQYGLQGTRGSWWPQITQADYRNVQSPYNLYLNLGLPPGPIANPGRAAIEGAVYPDETDYYYFQARCDGSGYHNFSQTYEQHLQNSC
ncbi:MAG: endolytic transglycosylase MltG [Anaerolineaceae bacterium]|nr:endolytic transglycosylase MltG [Anaerolineaceae bacterium]